MRAPGAVVASLVVLVAFAPWAGAANSPSTNRLVSHAASSPFQGSNTNMQPPYSISADGHLVAYRADPQASTPNLVSNYVDNSGGQSQIFLYDTATGANALVSHKVNEESQTGNGFAQDATISPDGRFVVYESSSTDLISGFQDHNGTGLDVFAYDTTTKENQLVSHSTASDVDSGNERSSQLGPNIGLSADGKKIIFRSEATDLVASFTDHNGADADLYLYDLSTKTMRLVSGSTATDGGNARLTDDSPSMSSDGKEIVYGSYATDLVPGFSDQNSSSRPDLYLFNADTGKNTLITHEFASPTSGGNETTFTTAAPAISANGARVVYQSQATNLVEGFVDGNAGGTDVFVYNVSNGKNRLVSHAFGSAKQGGDGSSEEPQISASGRAIAYSSKANNLVKGFVDGYNPSQPDVYRWTSKHGRNRLITRAVGTANQGQNGIATFIGLSNDGRHVAYRTLANNAVAGFVSGGSGENVYVFSVDTGRATLASHDSTDTLKGGDASSFSFASPKPLSADGRSVVYLSKATNLVPSYASGNGGGFDLYLYGP